MVVSSADGLISIALITRNIPPGLFQQPHLCGFPGYCYCEMLFDNWTVSRYY